MKVLVKAASAVTVSVALVFTSVQPVAAATQVPGVQTAYQAWTLYRCLRGTPMADGATFVDTDTFDCSLRRALDARDDDPVRVLFPSGAAYATAATGSNIRSALPGRIERWAQAVDQTGGSVYVCREGGEESWGLLLGLAISAATWIMRQLSPSGTAYYAPALQRDLFIEYEATASPVGARLVGVTFQPRVAPPPAQPPEGCEPADLS